MDEPKDSEGYVFWGPVTVKEIKTILSQKIRPEKIGRRNTICETQPSRTIYADSPTTNMLIQRHYFGDPVDDVNVSFTSEYFTPNETAHNDRLDEAGCSTPRKDTEEKVFNTKDTENFQDCLTTYKDKSSINNKETLIDKISKVLDCQTSEYASAGECSNCSNANIVNLNDETTKEKSQFVDEESPSLLILSDDDDDDDVEEPCKNVVELESSGIKTDNYEVIVISDDDDDDDLFEVQEQIKDEASSLNNTNSKFIANTRFSKPSTSKQFKEDESVDSRYSAKLQPSCSSFIREHNSNYATTDLSCNFSKQSANSKLNSYYSKEESACDHRVTFSEILPHSFYEHNSYRESNTSNSAFQGKLNNLEISHNKMENCTEESPRIMNTCNQNDTSIDLKLNFTELLQRSTDEHINNSIANISSEENASNINLETSEDSRNEKVNEKSYTGNFSRVSNSEKKDSNEEDLVDLSLNSSRSSVTEEFVCLTPNDNSVINSSVDQSHDTNEHASRTSVNSKLEWNDTIEEMERYLQAEEHNLFENNENDLESHTGNNSITVDNSLRSDSLSNGTKPKKSLIPVKNAPQSHMPTKTNKNGNLNIPTRFGIVNKKSHETVLSPVGLYIKNSPKAPLVQRIPSKSIPKTHLFPKAGPGKKANKENEFELPPRVYKPAKHIVVTEQQQLKLPGNIQKHIPRIPDIIRHQGRVGDKKLNQNSTEERLLTENLTFCGNDTTFSTSSIDGEISMLVSKKAFIK